MLPGAGCSREGEAGLQRARQSCGFFFFFPWPCTRESILKLCPCHSEKCFWLSKMEEELWSRNGALTVSSQGAKLLFRNPHCTWDRNSGTHGLCFNIQLLEYGRSNRLSTKPTPFTVEATRGRWRRWLKRVILVSCWGQTNPLLPNPAASSFSCFRVQNTCIGIEIDECDQQELCPFFLLLSSLLPLPKLPPPESFFLSSLFLGFLCPPLSFPAPSSLLRNSSIGNSMPQYHQPSRQVTITTENKKCGYLCYDLVNLYT